MYKSLSITLVLLITSMVSMAQSQSEQEAVKQAFNNYKTAILNDEGTKAATCTNSKTITYYNNILEKVKHTDSVSINNLKLLDRFTVFAIRYRTSKQDIMKFNGRSLLIHVINMGMVGKNSVMNNTIGDVEINGHTAKGQLLVNGNASPFQMKFTKESGQWKIDITSVFPIAETAFTKMIQSSGQDENMYLLMILSMTTKDKPQNNIWKAVAS